MRQDKKTIALINFLYYRDLNISEIEDLVSKNYKRNWRFRNITHLGETLLYEGFMAAYGNLKFNISVATLGGLVISKKFMLETFTELECKKPYTPYISEYDIPYVLNQLLPILRPRIHVMEDNNVVVIDTTLTDRLNTINENYQELLMGDSSRFFNNLTWHRLNSYQYTPKENPLRRYFGMNEIQIIKKLLYSPNHIVAIYAYEILKESHVQVSSNEKDKMNSIYNSDIKIKWWSHDVGFSGKTYKELKPTSKN